MIRGIQIAFSFIMISFASGAFSQNGIILPDYCAANKTSKVIYQVCLSNVSGSKNKFLSIANFRAGADLNLAYPLVNSLFGAVNVEKVGQTTVYKTVTANVKTTLIEGELKIASLDSREVQLSVKKTDKGLVGTLTVEGNLIEGWKDVPLKPFQEN